MMVNVIYACKSKLVGIDSVLPLLMEIKERFPESNIVILFPDEKTHVRVRKNYHIWKALEKIRFQSFVIRRKTKIAKYFELLRIVALMAFKKNILLKQNEMLPRHAKFVSIIKLLSNTVEIKAFIGGWTIEFHELLERIKALDRRNRLGDSLPAMQMRKRNGSYDYFISSLTRPLLKTIYGIEVEKEKFQKIGYLKNLPAWSSFVKQEVAHMQRGGQPYFVYFLSGFYDSTKYLYQPLEESLCVLKRYNQQIRTVFKPAFISIMDDFSELIRKVDYKNYEISYAHPSIVSYHSLFVMSHVFTTALFDAYVLGKPVVVYTQHADPCYYDILGNQTEGGRASDHTIFGDPKQLEAVLDSLTNNPPRIERDQKFLMQNFPKTPPDFWTFWDGILTQLSSKKPMCQTTCELYDK